MGLVGQAVRVAQALGLGGVAYTFGNWFWPTDTRIPAPLFGGQWGVAGAGRGGVHENGQVAGVGWVVVGSNLGM